MDYIDIKPTSECLAYRVYLNNGKQFDFVNEESSTVDIVKRLVEMKGYKYSDVVRIEKRYQGTDSPQFPLNTEEEVLYAIENFNLVDPIDEAELAADINAAIDSLGITDITLSATNKFNDYYTPKILVKYHANIDPIEISDIGNFVDLRAAQEYRISKGDYTMIDLGISVKLPNGYWAQIVPRSSLFKNHGLIQTNSFGVIDTSYSGNDDYWMLPTYATRDTVIEQNERICQFRIVKDIPFSIKTVWSLSDTNRGGFGSTGRD